MYASTYRFYWTTKSDAWRLLELVQHRKTYFRKEFLQLEDGLAQIRTISWVGKTFPNLQIFGRKTFWHFYVVVTLVPFELQSEAIMSGWLQATVIIFDPIDCFHCLFKFLAFSGCPVTIVPTAAARVRYVLLLRHIP